MIYFNFYNVLYIRVCQHSESDLLGICQKLRKYSTKTGNAISDDKTLNVIYVKAIKTRDLYYLGREAAYNEDFFILDRKGSKLLFDPESVFSGGEIKVESGFDEDMFATILESVIFMRLLLADIIPVHSCSIELSGEGILFPAWGGVGKTQLLLNLTSNGARFVSDEWTFIRNDLLLSFDIDFLMLDYDLRKYADKIRLSFLDRQRLVLGSKINSNAIKPLLSYFNLILSNKKYDPEKIFPAITRKTKLEKVCLLQKSSREILQKEKSDVNVLADKLTISFFHENRTLFYFYNLYKYALQRNNKILDTIHSTYAQKLSDSIRDKRTLTLTLPMCTKDIDIANIL